MTFRYKDIFGLINPLWWTGNLNLNHLKEDKMSSSVLIDFFHLLATVAWIGGMIYNAAIFPGLLGAVEPPQRGRVMGAMAKRFTIMSWLSVLILLVTGILKTPSSMLFDTVSSYGLILTVKHVMIILMIIFGLMITLVFAPKLRRYIPSPGNGPAPEFIAAQNGIKIFSSLNTLLGLGVLFCVALLHG